MLNETLWVRPKLTKSDDAFEMAIRLFEVDASPRMVFAPVYDFKSRRVLNVKASTLDGKSAKLT